MSEHEPGSRIGEYVVESRLGVGGMGTVYGARHAESGALVALKIMHADSAHQDLLRRRFLREARATMALSHPNLIRIVSSFELEGEPIIAMELLRGISLKDYLRQHGKLPFSEVASIFVRIVSGVGSAHALGLVHRDLKPDNVFLLEAAPHVKVLDFGIAKLREGGALDASGALTKTGMMIGTPYYMAPEQAYGEKSVDHRADIWSLGMMLHEVLTGTLLTRANDLEEVFKRMLQVEFPKLSAVEPSVPEDVSDLVSRMLERGADARPDDLREVLAVLAAHAPRVGTSNFDAAAKPIVFDEAAGASGSQASVKAAADPSTKSEPLKLAPLPMKSTSATHKTASGTVIVERDEALLPARSAENVSGTLAVTAGDARLSSARVQSRPPSQLLPPDRAPATQIWKWLIAAAIVLVSAALLIRELF